MERMTRPHPIGGGVFPRYIIVQRGSCSGAGRKSVERREEGLGALELEGLTWREVRGQQEAGRVTVVCALGATEPHGSQLPVGTDSLVGDRLARQVADRLDAFVAPTVRMGWSQDHVGSPGTLSLSEATFSGLVADLVKSFARGGFRRAILIPTSEGNFAALAMAMQKLGRVDGIEVSAVTDPGVFRAVGLLAAEDHRAPLLNGKLHGGEWEASMMTAMHPELVRPHRGGPRDPYAADAEHGRHYWEVLLALVLQVIGDA